MTRTELANNIAKTVLQTTVAFLETKGYETELESLVTDLGKQLADEKSANFVKRNHIENLMDVLQQALIYHKDGIH